MQTPQPPMVQVHRVPPTELPKPQRIPRSNTSPCPMTLHWQTSTVPSVRRSSRRSGTMKPRNGSGWMRPKLEGGSTMQVVMRKPPRTAQGPRPAILLLSLRCWGSVKQRYVYSNCPSQWELVLTRGATGWGSQRIKGENQDGGGRWISALTLSMLDGHFRCSAEGTLLCILLSHLV